MAPVVDLAFKHQTGKSILRNESTYLIGRLKLHFDTECIGIERINLSVEGMDVLSN